MQRLVPLPHSSRFASRTGVALRTLTTNNDKWRAVGLMLANDHCVHTSYSVAVVEL